MADLIPTTPASVPSTPYTVLARRYRSTDFDEVVGQEPIARTLKNAIARGRTAHAYLFTGTRGVGKTSMARIFAKALNATDDLTQKDEIARAILRGEDIDVIEIDGASNRGIDEVRDLIANAGLSPARCPYKVYIIDEVHMLTTQAFNALLKIMEEPPSHVKFILCTTEVHKVPATIQSRCQRFDFRNISAVRIGEHLRDILEREHIEADEGVVFEVARLAGGSMRDALSLLDRLIAAGEGRLTTEVLRDTLGTPDHAYVARLVDAVVAGEPAAALDAAGELLNHGTSIEQALVILTEHLRNVMVVATCGKDSPLFELFGEAREAAVRHAESLDAAGLSHMIALLEAASDRIRRSAAARALFDAVIVRIALTEQVALIPTLLGADGSISEKKKPLTAQAAPPPQPQHRVDQPRPAPRTAPAQEPRIEPKPAAPGGPSREAVEEVKKHPAVAKALDLFNGRITAVDDLPATARLQDDDNV